MGETAFGETPYKGVGWFENVQVKETYKLLGNTLPSLWYSINELCSSRNRT